jgi:hypothetical protein
MFDGEKYYEEAITKFNYFDIGHEIPEKNIFALYAPSLNTFLLVDYNYRLLQKLRLILSSKIRLEIINLSLNTYNYNDPVLTNHNCLFYKPIQAQGFQPTYINVRDTINFKISKNVLTQEQLDRIIELQEYVFFCHNMIKDYYIFFCNRFVSYEIENSLEEIHFIKTILNDSTLNNFFDEELNHINKNLFLINIIDRCLYNSNDINDFMNNAKIKFIEHKDVLLKDYKVESLVIGHKIGIFTE